jgi:hypothetical protein
MLLRVKTGQVHTGGIACINVVGNAPEATFYGPRMGDLSTAVDILKWRLMCLFMNIGYGADGPKKSAPLGRIIRAAPG